MTTDSSHGSSGVFPCCSHSHKGPLKTSLLFPNGLTPCLRRDGRGKTERGRGRWRERMRNLDGEKQREKQRWSFKMIAMFPKGLASVQGESFREQTVKCVLSNEATVQLSQSLFSALLVHPEHWEHMFSLYRRSRFIPFLLWPPVWFFPSTSFQFVLRSLIFSL